MRAWRSFGMVLDRKGRETAVPNPFKGLIIQIQVGYFDLTVVD